MRLFTLLTDGGSDADATGGTHYECRDCGTNVDADATGCPTCGGEVAVYTF
jgi:rubrerythrin